MMKHFKKEWYRGYNKYFVLRSFGWCMKTIYIKHTFTHVLGNVMNSVKLYAHLKDFTIINSIGTKEVLMSNKLENSNKSVGVNIYCVQYVSKPLFN